MPNYRSVLARFRNAVYFNGVCPPEDGGLGAEGNDSEALAAALVCIPITVAATTRDVMVEVRTDSPNRLAFPAPVHVHLPRHP